MKKVLKVFIVAITIMLIATIGSPKIQASPKTNQSRAIAIVFDNSGSMYMGGNQAWCRATYAMEVFASMLNDEDSLEIYPMHPMEVNNAEYSMENPFKLTSPKQASSLREIFTKDAGKTPIESIDFALEGLKKTVADKKYLVVLTDGGTFNKKGAGLSKERTVVELDKRVQDNAGKEISVMYLGIGQEACVPATAESEYFVKRKVVNSEDVLSTLTELCNLVFGRDVLPRNHVSGNTIDFDISMKKLIVFVQGDNISDLKLTTNGEMPTLVNSQQTSYSTKGAGDYTSNPDTSLQGMMITYKDCIAGSYNIEYNGTASSVEIYYEPDADLEFIFTDSDGNDVDPTSLYEGDYKVSFGMKDAKTGQLISSDLLGNPHYEGSYTVNSEKTNFEHDGYNGEVPVALRMNDTFEADLTVTYLSGYTISKDSADFGWPTGGIRVLASPLGKLNLKMSIDESYILISDIDKSDAIVIDLTIDGQKLSPEEFAAITLTADAQGLPFKLTPNESKSQYILKLESKGELEEGKYTIKANADYLDFAEREAHANDLLHITLSKTPLWLKWAKRFGIALLALAILIWLLHRKVYPRKIRTKDNKALFNRKDLGLNVNATRQGDTLKIAGEAPVGQKQVFTISVKPGDDSYLRKSNKNRSFAAKPGTIKRVAGNITDVEIGNVAFKANKKTGNLEPVDENLLKKTIKIKDKTEIRMSGTERSNNRDEKFNIYTTISLAKKK